MGLIRRFVLCLVIHAFQAEALDMVKGILSRQRRGLCRHYRGRRFARKKSYFTSNMQVPLPGDMSTGQVARQLVVFGGRKLPFSPTNGLIKNHNLSYCGKTEKQRVTRHNVTIRGPQVDFLIELFFHLEFKPE